MKISKGKLTRRLRGIKEAIQILNYKKIPSLVDNNSRSDQSFRAMAKK